MTLSREAAAAPHLELLVSVRSLAEAELAAAEPIDILDFKEPSLGALAPVSSSIWEAAAAQMATAPRLIPLSAALGEGADAIATAALVPPRFAFAKAGPQGRATSRALMRLWDCLLERLPTSVQLVAVAYADHDNASCVSPAEVIACAGERGFQRILIDTFAKDGHSSVDHLTAAGLSRLRALARDAGMRLMLAGSIRQSEVRHWVDASNCPDGIGLRGDLCRSGRSGDLDPARIRSWRWELDRLASRFQTCDAIASHTSQLCGNESKPATPSRAR